MFTALLAAENIKAVPVLINSGAKIDPDVIAQAIRSRHPAAAGQGAVFLDTTPEVLPYVADGQLARQQALVIPAQG